MARTTSILSDRFLRQLEHLYISAQRLTGGRHTGFRESRAPGHGIEFYDHRAYGVGDDLRHIDWRVYGRTQKLYRKLYENNQDLNVYLFADISASMHIGNVGYTTKWEFSKQLIAALAYMSLRNQDTVSVWPYSNSLYLPLPPCRGYRQSHKIFSYLNDLINDATSSSPRRQTNTLAAIEEFIRRPIRPGTAVICSDFYEPIETIFKSLDKLRYHKLTPVILQLVDPFDFLIPIDSELELVDSESGQIRKITPDSHLSKHLEQAHTAFSQRLEDYAKKYGLHYFKISTQNAPEDVIIELFSRAGLLKGKA